MYMTERIATFSLMLPLIFMLGVTIVAALGVPGDSAIAIIMDRILNKETQIDTELNNNTILE